MSERRSSSTGGRGVRYPPAAGACCVRLRDRLASFEVEPVGIMEATAGVYRKPVHYPLEDDDFECRLPNARHLKGTSLKGRKTGVEDAEWISASWSSTASRARASCLRRGLGSRGTSPATARGLRIEERTREVQRLDKALQDAGIGLSCVVTRLLGGSAGGAMLDALVETAPPTRRYWRSWLGGSCVRSRPRFGMLWRVASPPVMPPW